MTEEFHPETVILEMGGCGRFQISLSVLVHVMKLVVCWSMVNMVYSFASPSWWCADGLDLTNTTSELSENSSRFKACSIDNDTKCSSFVFDTEKNTIVSEFSLVCDDAWIPSTAASIQMAGVFIGNVMSGHMADGIGRKRPFFLSMVILSVFNIAGAFSVSWVMYAITRCFIGAGAGFFLTIQYTLVSEFTLAKWRSWIINFPSWAVETCLFALVAWWLHDWKSLQIATGILTVPFLAAWWYIPESFRWYISHDRDKDAEDVVKFIAKINNHPTPNTERLRAMAQPSPEDKSRKMSFIELFRTKYLIKITLCSIFNWIALGLVGYGIGFGITTLSGSLYFNIFLFALLSCPTKLWSIYSQNRFGRKKTIIVIYLIITVAAAIAGAVQYVDITMKESLTNGLAIVCSTFIEAAWGPVQTVTVEMYPTVIRNIGFGFLSIFARIGSVIGPQLVFMSYLVPGLLYFVCGAISVLCVLATLGLPETREANLEDKMKKQTHELQDFDEV